MIIIGITNIIFKSGYFIFAENLDDFKKSKDQDWNLYNYIEMTEVVPTSIVEKIRLIIAATPKEYLDNIAAALFFGLYAGREEGRIKLDEVRRKSPYRW